MVSAGNYRNGSAENDQLTHSTEWKGRPDGLVAHAYFKDNYNFALSCFAFAVEGYVSASQKLV